MEVKRDQEKPQNRLTPHVPAFCDLSVIVGEVAAGTFAKRQKLGPTKIKEIWEALCFFVADSIKHMKGVMIPTLGNFHVGHVYEYEALSDDNLIRPTFRLLENRFAGVTQARGRFRAAQRGRIVQPNFHTISRRTRLLRATCQRVVRDLLVQLGIHIVAGHQLKVDFPKVGLLLTNKKGSIKFEFSSALLQQFGRIEWDQEDGVNMSLAKEKAGMVADLAMEGSLQPVSTVHDLMKLCRQQDRISSGCVPRLMLERWLQRDVRHLVDGLGAETVLDLLAVHTYGKTGRFVLYPSFVEALEKLSGGGLARSTKTSSHRGTKKQNKMLEDSAQGLSSAIANVSLLGHAGGEDEAGGSDEEDHNCGGEEHDLGGAAEQATAAAVLDDSRPSTAGSYYLQYKNRPINRKETDDFNRQHFARLQETRRNGITPKVGVDPLNVDEVQALHERLKALPDPLRRPPSPELRRRISHQNVRVDEYSNVLVPLPRFQATDKEQEDLRAAIADEKKAALRKKHAMRDQLQNSWEVQEVERAKVAEMFRKSEEAWPYSPAHHPEVRLPLSGPRAAVNTRQPAPRAH
eukprot:CAMPEP_0117665598 /NCGR_PEP_ID=MMETSP0804-20121206/9903_1 /TAXON_ID=1074897 /ORGANISM="Tetraselmis astigmatica, Strain CCMP880" /LENGTH=573 /DNA_ID=CAMNT_0005473037 /DNA_START=90 /DNA_END=1811 /DNA_ORIENTATION=-